MNKYISFFVIVMLVLVGGCNSAKTVVDAGGKKEQFSLSDRMFLKVKSAEYVSYRMKLSAEFGEKHVSANSTLKIKNNELIILSVTMPLLGIELGRIEIDNDNVLVIDKFHKMFVGVPFEYLSGIAGSEINLSTVQALFLNDIFLLGNGRNSHNGKYHRLFEELDMENGNKRLTQKNTGGKVGFEVNPASEFLLKTVIACSGNERVDCLYSDFSEVNGVYYPKNLRIDFGMSFSSLSLNMDISRISNDRTPMSRTDLSGYRSVTLEQCLKMLKDI